jgi:hypothetical protein
LSKADPRVKRLIISRARKYGIDPVAALAVARGEGGLVNRKDDIGDLAGGGSYGPFQLYAQGALPKKFRGNPALADKWAWSPAGIDYALRKMKESGASGLKGEAAVNAIVRKFERPADPDTSVANAVARLGSIKLKGGQPAPAPSVRQTTSSPAIPQQAFGTLNDLFRKVGLAPLDVVGDMPLGVPGRVAAPSPPAATAAPALSPTPNGKLPRFRKLDLAVHLIQKAQSMGLTVKENPFVDGVDPVHVRGSDHYRVLGKRKGKKVGAGGDVSGDPETMRAFFEYASQYAGKGLKDLFHDPVGYSYDNGKRWNKTIGGHGKHVHWSVG